MFRKEGFQLANDGIGVLYGSKHKRKAIMAIAYNFTWEPSRYSPFCLFLAQSRQQSSAPLETGSGQPSNIAAIKGDDTCTTAIP